MKINFPLLGAIELTRNHVLAMAIPFFFVVLLFLVSFLIFPPLTFIIISRFLSSFFGKIFILLIFGVFYFLAKNKDVKNSLSFGILFLIISLIILLFTLVASPIIQQKFQVTFDLTIYSLALLEGLILNMLVLAGLFASFNAKSRQIGIYGAIALPILSFISICTVLPFFGETAKCSIDLDSIITNIILGFSITSLIIELQNKKEYKLILIVAVMFLFYFLSPISNLAFLLYCIFLGFFIGEDIYLKKKEQK